MLDERRQTETQLGLALQHCALLYPGRLVQRGEMIPEVALAFLADQLGLEPDVLTNLPGALRPAVNNWPSFAGHTASRI
ncbi:DUF4158 domain-containing protein [Mesorhizobium sp.]|uniref:DUF4158 domain-containing protein n=1 Tax=Mesorhizobium sp. TaxID=1871066 RepID=UPI0025C6A0E1|nr:DUF4158 domain-containing protein [Mesorhizobium sp.]